MLGEMAGRGRQKDDEGENCRQDLKSGIVIAGRPFFH
jgi:hypothetical protein